MITTIISIRIEYYIGGGVYLDIYYNKPRDIIFIYV